jgi:hypothetical protein
VVEQALRPTVEEVRMNSRSRSAVLHVLRREVDVVMSDIEAVAVPVLGWTPYPAEAPAFTPSSHTASLDAEASPTKKEKKEKKEKKSKKSKKEKAKMTDEDPK